MILKEGYDFVNHLTFLLSGGGAGKATLSPAFCVQVEAGNGKYLNA